MKLMTSATMNNPGNLQNVLTQMRKDKLFKAKESRVSAMTEKIIDGISNLSPEEQADQNTVLQIARDSFDPKSTVAEKEMAINMAFTFQKRAQQQKAYGREEQEYERGEAERIAQTGDVSVLAQMGRQEGEVTPEQTESYLSKLSDKGFLNYQAQQQAGQAAKSKSALDRRFTESQITKNLRVPGGTTAGVLDRNKEEALNSFAAQLSSIGGSYDPMSMRVTVPTDKAGAIDDNTKTILAQSGFGIFPVKDGRIEEDIPWSFKEKYYQLYQLGGFNSTGGKKGPDGVEVLPQIQKQRKPLSSFNLKEVDAAAGISETVDQQDPFVDVESRTAIDDIKSKDRELVINPALPPDPKTWELKTEIINGKPSKYVMVEGQKIKLTREELGLYYESQKLGQKSKFLKWIKDDPTGIKKLRKDYTAIDNE